jgi:FkbM family methyltransferase
MNSSHLFGRIHRFLSSRPLIVRAAVKARNQANAIVATHFSRLSVSTDSTANGENRLAEHVAPHARNFVDVGGNQGHWTAHFLRYVQGRPSGLIYEPNQACAMALQRRFASTEAVEVVHAAVADYLGEAEFYESSDDDQLSSLSAISAGPFAAPRRVPVVTLDDELKRRRWDRISFLKIDTEGHDYFVLRGARRLLSEGRVDLLQFECNNTWNATGITLRAAVNFLKPFGYSVRHLRPEGLFAVDYVFFGSEFGYGNWVAFHQGTEALLKPLLR